MRDRGATARRPDGRGPSSERTPVVLHEGEHPFREAVLKRHRYGVGIYFALGDSISIDDYTGVHGGGAASQLARKLAIELVDLTVDGNTTDGVLAASFGHRRPRMS